MIIDKFTKLLNRRVDLSKLDAYHPLTKKETLLLVSGYKIIIDMSYQEFEEILSKRSEYEMDRDVYKNTLFDYQHFSYDIEEFIQEVEQYKEHKNYEKMKLLYHGIILQYFKCHNTKGEIFQENLETFINNFRNAKFDFYQILIPDNQ
jgi:hypothetical protein